MGINERFGIRMGEMPLYPPPGRGSGFSYWNRETNGPLTFKEADGFLKKRWWIGGICIFYPNHTDNLISTEEMREWLSKNLPRRYKMVEKEEISYSNNIGIVRSVYTIYFRDEESTIAFKLRFV